ncbi:hypothetical protein J6590_101001 [Homalodisca vitripennis]|nr:hypothetical protein J6590_101001 [Homalodisca vitripennis]
MPKGTETREGNKLDEVQSHVLIVVCGNLQDYLFIKGKVMHCSESALIGSSSMMMATTLSFPALNGNKICQESHCSTWRTTLFSTKVVYDPQGGSIITDWRGLNAGKHKI